MGASSLTTNTKTAAYHSGSSLGEMADIYVNDFPLGRGEVVVIGDALHVRIAEIHYLGEKESGNE